MIDTETGTYQHNEALLDELTHLNRAERGALISWFARQGEATQLEAIRLQTGVLRSLHKSGEGRDPKFRGEIVLAALILALNKMRHLDAAMKRKGNDPEAARAIVDHRIARIKAKKKAATAPEREKLRTQYYHVVRTLRAKGMSWRECAAYMSEHHHQSWSHGWLRNAFTSITEERRLALIPETEN